MNYNKNIQLPKLRVTSSSLAYRSIKNQALTNVSAFLLPFLYIAIGSFRGIVPILICLFYVKHKNNTYPLFYSKY